jgi:translocation and assembly module TamA
VPSNYLGEALFSRTLYAELRGSHTALGSDSDFLQLRVQGERVFDFAPKWHVLLRGDIGATAVSSTTVSPPHGDSSPAAIAAFAFAVNELSPVNG